MGSLDFVMKCFKSDDVAKNEKCFRIGFTTNGDSFFTSC